MADIGEAEQFELRRSPRTQVSQRVAAINDDRPRAVEQLWRVAQDMPDWNVNRATDMRSLEFVRR